jgi:hypothetical protein
MGSDVGWRILQRHALQRLRTSCSCTAVPSRLALRLSRIISMVLEQLPQLMSSRCTILTQLLTLGSH